MKKPERKKYNYKKIEFPLTVSGHHGYNEGWDAWELYHNSIIAEKDKEIAILKSLKLTIGETVDALPPNWRTAGFEDIIDAFQNAQIAKERRVRNEE